MSDEKILQTYKAAADSSYVHAAIQGIPWVGGSLDTLLFAQAMKWKEQRIQEMLDGLKCDVEALGEEKINKAFFETEEALSLFERSFAEIIKEHDTKKREILRRALLSVGRVDFASNLGRDFLLETLLGLNVDQVRILKYCFDKHGHLGFDDLRNLKGAEKDVVASYGELEKVFSWPQGSYEKKGLIDDLQSKGLLFDWWTGRLDYTPFWFAITDFGKEIVKTLLKDQVV